MPPTDSDGVGMGEVRGGHEPGRSAGTDGRFGARFVSLLEASTDAIVCTDPSGLILVANTRAEAMFGHAAGGLVGARLETLLPEELRAGHVAPVRAPEQALGQSTGGSSRIAAATSALE